MEFGLLGILGGFLGSMVLGRGKAKQQKREAKVSSGMLKEQRQRDKQSEAMLKVMSAPSVGRQRGIESLSPLGGLFM